MLAVTEEIIIHLGHQHSTACLPQAASFQCYIPLAWPCTGDSKLNPKSRIPCLHLAEHMETEEFDLLGNSLLASAVPFLKRPQKHDINSKHCRAWCSVQGWFPCKSWGYGPVRRFIIIFTILAICLGISLAAPGQSAQIVVITGASGVFLSCYLIPIINHLMLYFGRCAVLHAFEVLHSMEPSLTENVSAKGSQEVLPCRDAKGCSMREVLLARWCLACPCYDR